MKVGQVKNLRFWDKRHSGTVIEFIITGLRKRRCCCTVEATGRPDLD